MTIITTPITTTRSPPSGHCPAADHQGRRIRRPVARRRRGRRPRLRQLLRHHHPGRRRHGAAGQPDEGPPARPGRQHHRDRPRHPRRLGLRPAARRRSPGARCSRLIDTFFGLGPFGFRGPAASHVPGPPDARRTPAIRTAQVIAPGYACPSNDFLALAADRAATRPALHHLGQPVPAPDRRRRLPAHWTAAGLRAEFGDEPELPGRSSIPTRPTARAAYPQLPADVDDDPRLPPGRPGARRPAPAA